MVTRTTVDVLQAAGRNWIKRHKLNETFLRIDLQRLNALHAAWTEHLPDVAPFYAVKCNPDRGILKRLAALGSGFDCASMNEMKAVMRLGVPAERILFANPAKIPRHIQHAAAVGVRKMTFDSLCELNKMDELYPSCEALLRIHVAGDPSAKCQLGDKYGARDADIPELLAEALRKGIRLTGIAFHIGSGGTDFTCIDAALLKSKRILEQAHSMGHVHMSMVDIGGGFTPDTTAEGGICMARLKRSIQDPINQHFPSKALSSGVRIRFVAEPGRFFTESVVTLYSPIYTKRVRGEASPEYWIMEGLYGAFNCMIYDKQIPTAIPLLMRTRMGSGSGDKLLPSVVWGPTCDNFDRVYSDIPLPPNLEVGDWLMFPNAGAYTVAGACDFNGMEFTRPKKFYVKG